MELPESRNIKLLLKSRGAVSNVAELIEYHRVHSKLEILVISSIVCLLIWFLFTWNQVSEV